MLPFLENVGDDPENPGFCIPRPSVGFFLRLDLAGALGNVKDEPLEPSVVDVVLTEFILPFVVVVEGTYGLPLASVIDISAAV